MFHQIADSLDFSRHGRQLSSIRLAAAAMAGLAIAIAAQRSDPRTILMGVGVAAIAVLLVIEAGRSVRGISNRSQMAREAAVLAERHYIDVLRRIVRIVESRDRYTHGHSQRVGQLAGRIATQLGLPDDLRQALVVAGELLDIGLLAVSDEILNKRSGFGPSDLRSVQKHSEVSYEVLKPLASLSDVMGGIRYHHERMNGTGYPRGLSGQEVPLQARVLAVADAYDAITHDRPHRSALSPLQALREMQRCTPAGYDEACVSALAKILNLGD